MKHDVTRQFDLSKQITLDDLEQKTCLTIPVSVAANVLGIEYQNVVRGIQKGKYSFPAMKMNGRWYIDRRMFIDYVRRFQSMLYYGEFKS